MSAREEMDYKEREAAKIAARAVSDYLNSHGFGNGEQVLAEELLNDHPTLQQAKIRMVVKMFLVLASRDERFFDLRNEDSKRLADKLKPILEDSPLRFI